MTLPLILAFDTSAAHCAAALLRGEDIIASRVDAMGKGQAEHLMPMLVDVLQGAGHGWRDLAAIGVGVGPGNFTGIRISVAAARGLALGLGVPAVGVTGFEAAAHGLPRPVCVLLPAPREQVYMQRLDDTGPGMARLLARVDVPGGQSFAPLRPAQEMVAAIARIAAIRWQSAPPRPAPFYVRSADAAPPRDAAPVILPA